MTTAGAEIRQSVLAAALLIASAAGAAQLPLDPREWPRTEFFAGGRIISSKTGDSPIHGGHHEPY